MFDDHLKAQKLSLMSYNSFDSSQESQDSKDVKKIEDTILDIVNNDLNKDLTDKRKTIKNLQIAVTSSRKIFQNKFKLLHQIIQKIITYCIMSEKDFFIKNGKGESFDDIIIELVSIYPLNMRDLFIKSLINSIFDLYSPEKPNKSKKSLLLPNVEEKIISIECEPDFYAVFYLTLLYKISIRFQFNYPYLINLFHLLLSNEDYDVQLIALKIMTEISSISTTFSYQMIHLILFYIERYLQNPSQIYQETIDSLLVSIFDKSINVIPPYIRSLVGREIFSYLPQFSIIIEWQLIDRILNLVNEFIKADHVNSQLCASFFINLFRDYFINDTFISICHLIAIENTSFKKKLWSKYSTQCIYIPALLTICPDYEFDIDMLETIEPPLLYDILILIKSIPENIEEALRKLLIDFPPSEKHIKCLIDFIPEMPLENYPPDIICSILKEDKKRIAINYGQLKKVALDSKSIKLISFLAENCPDDRNSYTNVISSFTNDINAWEDQNFRNLIAQIFIAGKKQIKKQKDFFTGLLYSSKLKLMYYIGQEKPLWKLFLWLILRECTTGKDNYSAEAAVAVLLQLENFQEIYHNNSFYFFKHLLVLLDESNYSYLENIIMILFPHDPKLSNYAGEIVPILIRNQDSDGLKNYFRLAFADQSSSQEEEAFQNFINRNLTNIFFYLFVYCQKSEPGRKKVVESLNFLKKLTNKEATKLLKKCIGELAPKLLLYLGSDDIQLHECSKKAIDMVTTACNSGKAIPNRLNFFWEDNFLNTIVTFCKILNTKRSYHHKNVIKSLVYSVESIEPFFHNCYPRILSITEIAMRKQYLRELCIEFWVKLMISITIKSIFPKIFGPVISQFLPYFDEFPDQITEILSILIIDNSEYTNTCLIEIAHIPIFQEKPQLDQINNLIQKSNVKSESNWIRIVAKLSKQLNTTAAPFRNYILQQLYFTLKSNLKNLSEISSTDIAHLVRKLWYVSLHEKMPDYILYCAKCIALLPFDKDITPPEQAHKIDLEGNEIIISIIVNFLTKTLEDTSIYTNHDNAAYVIQELLKVLGCSSKSYEDLRQDEVWNKFPVEIQDVIYPFTRSRYNTNERRIMLDEIIEEIMQNPNLDVNTWLCHLTSYLLKINKSEKLRGLDACIYVLPNSPSLCKYLIPYLVFRNMEYKEYRQTLRSQWKALSKILNLDENSTTPHCREFAKQALLIFFSLFDTLAVLSISPSKKRPVPEWTILDIAPDDKIAAAALDCELYYRALQHIEFNIHHIRNNRIFQKSLDKIRKQQKAENGGSNEGSSYVNDLNGSEVNDEKEEADPFEGKSQILLKIFEHIDDPDGVEFLRRSSQIKQDSYDDSLVAFEIKTLAPRTEPIRKLDLIKEMIAKGRYERALSDALDLKNSLPGNIEVDAMIAKSALRLQRWEKMGQLSLPSSKENISPNNRQDAIDIITSRLIYFKKIGDSINFKNDLKLFGEIFVPMFQSAEMISYFRMIPLLVQLRLVEEIEEFCPASTVNSSCNSSSSSLNMSLTFSLNADGSLSGENNEQELNDQVVSDDYSKSSDYFMHWENGMAMKPEDIERIVAVRSALIGALVENPIASIKITSQWLQLARFCRKSMHLHNSKVFCSRANSFAISSLSQMYCSLEMAKVYFSLNHTNAAISILRQIIPKTLDNRQLLSKIKYIDASWADLLSSSDSRTIINTYSQSLEICQTAKAHLALANLVDNCVISLVNNFEQNSKESFQNQSKQQQNPHPSIFPPNPQTLQKNQKQATMAVQQQQQQTVVNRAALTNEVRKNSLFWTGRNQNKETPQVLLEFLPLALLNYMKAMIMSPDYSFEIVPRILVLMFDIGRYMIPVRSSAGSAENDIFRIVSSNYKSKILTKMKESIESNMNKVKSTIWVNSITQLISRIEQPHELLPTLHGFILPALKDYPQVTFWNLMSIKRAKEKQENFSALWNKFEKESSESQLRMKWINDLQFKYDMVIGQLIGLIQFRITQKDGILSIKCSSIAPALIEAIKNAEMIVPLSSTLTINSNQTPESYDKSVPKIIELDDTISIIRSQQCPKRITVRSSTGFPYHYLIKKDNDLRKDMRMMEFGSFINRLLNNDKRSRQKALSLITYAVICLDQNFGMIEWVEKTSTLGEIVSNIWKRQDVYNLIRSKEKIFISMCSGTSSKNEKYNYFVDVLLPVSPPVMHIWFAIQFRNLANWYQARLAFTRSVAIWSMIGFIVGLGDRHPDNLLINLKTGACFHVDFAILFDKGKTLTAPEIVPFRMTRNVVYGMSVLGTDGDFSATSSLILEILRENKAKILSVLQTFVHDPLIEWQLVTNANGNGVNNLAAWQGKMTLKEVERRLSGIIEDKLSTRSPDCVVQELIKQATDDENLSLMFHGWRALL